MDYPDEQYYQDQKGIIVNYSFRNKIQWNWNWNQIFMHENAFQDIVCNFLACCPGINMFYFVMQIITHNHSLVLFGGNDLSLVNCSNVYILHHPLSNSGIVVLFGAAISAVTTLSNTAQFHYNAVQFNMILPSGMRWQQNINQTSNSQQTPHTSPSWASYGMSYVRIQEKIDSILTEPHCML